MKLTCHVTGDPYPSVVWQTPLGDLISDPYRGQWLDNSINSTLGEVMYKIYATGEAISFSIKLVSSFLHPPTVFGGKTGYILFCPCLSPLIEGLSPLKYLSSHPKSVVFKLIFANSLKISVA